jgi:transposase
MWTQEHRRIYRREGEGYPSGLRDAEWARLEPLIPGATPGGRPRKTDTRDVLDTVLYILRTGCQWRYLPERYPPWGAVWRTHSPPIRSPWPFGSSCSGRRTRRRNDRREAPQFRTVCGRACVVIASNLRSAVSSSNMVDSGGPGSFPRAARFDRAAAGPNAGGRV